MTTQELMREVISLIKTQHPETGMLVLDADQTAKLVRFLESVSEVLEKQDALIKKLKELYP